MVIPSIDERDVHRCLGERLRHGKPGEASADNDDMRLRPNSDVARLVELLWRLQ